MNKSLEVQTVDGFQIVQVGDVKLRVFTRSLHKAGIALVDLQRARSVS